MTDTAIDVKRIIRPREWLVSQDGKKKSLGGRWDNRRVGEILEESRHKSHTMDDLARLVYGSTNQTNRDRVRSHIPRLRNYMMAKLTPVVTTFGVRGRIEFIKFYEADEQGDREKLNLELERMRSRNEISAERCLKLREVLSLPPPTEG